ncbi:hypothetical protein [Novipirellula sp.]|uniref:hypothetical protein n=1 Tax=Novipirellula sp. TaxID=2795430 RepID=UPI00356948C3
MSDFQTQHVLAFHDFSKSMFKQVLTCLIAAASVLCLMPQVSFAQGSGLGGFGTLGGVEPGGRYPSQEYYIALEMYRSGDLENAVDAFEAALRRTRRDINGRWIDSIPVYAMLAECYWQIGSVPQARENIDAAMQVAIRYRGWLNKVDWRSAVREGVQMSPPTGVWPAALAIKRVPTSDRIMFQSGQPLTEQTLIQGGVVEEPNLRAMDIIEIMRGLAIASYRRRIILGPLSEQDNFVNELAESTNVGGLPQPVAQTMSGALHAAARFAAHDDKRAFPEASKSALSSGGAHPLSAIALLVQASVLAESDNAEGSLAAALACVNVAAALEQPELIGEAMQLAAGVASEKEANVVRTAADTAANAMVRKSRLAAVHCFVASADAAIKSRDYAAATLSIGHAKSLSDRRDVLQPRIDAYGAYVAAKLAAGRGEAFGMKSTSVVDNAYGSMRTFAQQHRVRNRTLVSMPSTYQFALLSQSLGTRIGGSTSDAVLDYYTSDPPPALWRRDPVDAMTFLTIDRSAALAMRLAIAAEQTDGDKVLVRTDTLLAERFSQTLPLAGRVAHVRGLASAEDQTLSDDQRNFRNQGPAEFKQLRQMVLDNAKLTPATVNDSLVEKLGQQQESLATLIAFSRGSLPRLAPPRVDEKAPIQGLPKRTALVTFAFSGNRLYTTFSLNGKTQVWTNNNTSRLPAMVGSVLRSIGVGKTRGSRLPEDNAWRKDAAALLEFLFPEASSFAGTDIDDLVIVPDGPLWYLPFDILPIDGEDAEFLGDKISIRYAATPGLALRPAPIRQKNKAVGIAASRFFAPRDLEINTAITQSIVDAAAGSILLPVAEMPPTTMLGIVLDSLIVAAPSVMDTSNPFAMSVLPYEAGKPNAALGAWLQFPSQVPTTIAMAGFRSQAESPRLGDGRELFMTLCALHVAGVDDVLISRWAVGGESSAIVLREFSQELPFSGMVDAWRRARMVLRRTDLDPLTEPLLAHADKDLENVTGEEPLFWSGYLLSSPIDPSAAAKQ